LPVTLVFNKVDDLNEEERATLDYLTWIYRDIGYEVLQLSALHGQGVEQLAPLLTEKITLLAGHSGVGKSTLINLLAGLDTPDSGSVYAEGVTVSDQSEANRARFRLRHIAVIFQDDNLIAELTNTENIALPLWAQGTSKSDATEIAHEAMRKLGIESLGRRHPGEVSGGQRQRVGAARALASGQHILLADEPTGALDSTTSEGLFELLGNLAHDNQMCVIVATHDPLATKHCDSVTTLLDGQLVA